MSNEGRRRREGDSSRDALFRFMTPDRCERFETLVVVLFFFPLVRVLLAVLVDVSKPTSCSSLSMVD